VSSSSASTLSSVTGERRTDRLLGVSSVCYMWPGRRWLEAARTLDPWFCNRMRCFLCKWCRPRDEMAVGLLCGCSAMAFACSHARVPAAAVAWPSASPPSSAGLMCSPDLVTIGMGALCSAWQDGGLCSRTCSWFWVRLFLAALGLLILSNMYCLHKYPTHFSCSLLFFFPNSC
jgi:hypothetical protein